VICHATTATTTLLWSLVWEGENKVGFHLGITSMTLVSQSHPWVEAKVDALWVSKECAGLKMALADFQDKPMTGWR
jgi:hypothetical protein